jgi:hypothetical protein
VLQWSGDCCPFEAAVNATRALGVRNINGGDSRFDGEFPSYAWVAPIGRQIGDARQIYASNCNEEIYTDLWTGRYFGFRYLIETVRHTESPVRVSPLNIYFHMYSGEKQAALEALVENLKYARSQAIIPLTASHFAGIADGFFTARITRIGPAVWRIEQRDDLQTIRFDRSSLRRVDFAASRGVIGQRHLQGSLYVALDPAEPAAVVALRDEPAFGQDPAASEAYAVESRWPVSDLRRKPDGFSFRAAGFGDGEMTWMLPGADPVEVRITAASGTPVVRRVTPEGRRCRFSLGFGENVPVEVSVSRPEASR